MFALIINDDSSSNSLMVTNNSSIVCFSGVTMFVDDVKRLLMMGSRNLGVVKGSRCWVVVVVLRLVT